MRARSKTRIPGISKSKLGKMKRAARNQGQCQTFTAPKKAAIEIGKGRRKIIESKIANAAHIEPK